MTSQIQCKNWHSAPFLLIFLMRLAKSSGLQAILLSPVAGLFIHQLFEYLPQSIAMFTAESRSMVVTNSFFMVLAVLSVVLRFQVRRPKAFSFELDDYMIVTALVRLCHNIHMMPCPDCLFKVLRRGPCHYKHRRRFCCRLWNSVRIVE